MDPNLIILLAALGGGYFLYRTGKLAGVLSHIKELEAKAEAAVAAPAPASGPTTLAKLLSLQKAPAPVVAAPPASAPTADVSARIEALEKQLAALQAPAVAAKA